MIFEVDFAIQINNDFQTIHKELIFAESVTECMDKAKRTKERLFQKENHKVHIFIGA